ncbi:MAG: segregation/condensation protein A [Lachnospiraceae bacterium]|nr:segregation/condensation protein A [Lachnospiraceae bacterium]
MSLSVTLEKFEGPLDLLLHLIEKNKINIYDIPIVEITEQYMDYIRQMQEQDMEIMSEFLVMAATLLNIKSKMLLPQEEPENTEEPVDPRQELVERLLQYKMYKYASLELSDRQLDAGRVLFKEANLPPEIADYKEPIDTQALLSDLTLQKLHSIFESVMKKQVEKIDPVRSKFGRIEKEEVSMSKKMREIQEYALANKRFSFRALLMEQYDKMDVVVTFLCILELMKIGRMHVVQEEIFDEIEIEYLAEDIIDFEDSDF